MLYPALTNFFHRRDDFFGARQDGFLEPFVVRHRHILLRNPHDRRVEFIEYFLLNPVGDFGANAAEGTVLLYNDNTMGLRHGLQECRKIERLDRAQIEHLWR